MADRFVQRDFVWLLAFKGGTDRDRGQLLGQDLIKDLEASKGIWQQLRAHAAIMKTDKMTKTFRSVVEEISDIQESVSKEQWELQEICQKMRWPSGTTKISEDLGHAILEEDILPRFREYLQDSRSEAIRKHQVVVSERYRPLLEKLMAVRLTGEKQPKLDDQKTKKVPLPLAAKRLVSRAGVGAHHWVESVYEAYIAIAGKELMLSGFLVGPPWHLVVQPSCHVKLESKAIRWLAEPRREGRHLQAARTDVGG